MTRLTSPILPQPITPTPRGSSLILNVDAARAGEVDDALAGLNTAWGTKAVVDPSRATKGHATPRMFALELLESRTKVCGRVGIDGIACESVRWL